MSNHEFLHYKSLDSAHPRRISYLIFTRNRGPRLNDTIADVGTFIRPEDELIIADGASTDSTEEVVLRHRNIVHIFLSEKDRSAQHGLNKAVLLARGKYIIVLPDDDRLHGDGVEKAVGVMEKNSDIDLLVCGGIKHFVVRSTSRPFYYGPGMNYGSTAEHAFTYGTCGNGFVIRRSAFAKVGLFPLDAAEWDTIWFAQCIYHGGVTKFARINLFDHYITEDSISAKGRQKMIEQRTRFAKMYCSPAFVRAYRRKRSAFYRISGMGKLITITKSANKIIRKEGAGSLARMILRRFPEESGKKIKGSSAPVWDGGFS
ncbi:MAG: glycosyltransferase [bacterium]|nr:glycosyltransferase [bacterium]MDZ4286115.1 glycosyltransferase [Candidatus Sungbacteria bacterium]